MSGAPGRARPRSIGWKVERAQAPGLPPLSNALALFQPDADDLVRLDGVALSLARAAGELATPIIIAAGEAVMAGEVDDETVGVLLDNRRQLELAERLAAAADGDAVSLNRGERNALRTIAHLLLSAAWSPRERTRIPEHVLEAIGPWFEESPGTARADGAR